MKILVIQLARLGDIFTSWPALRALRRSYPQAEIHLLTRPRFEAAVEGLGAVDRHWSLPGSQILSPLLQTDPNIEASLQHLDVFTDNLKTENFDWVVNLTFSPASSYLVKVIGNPNTRISGYSRYEDGTLHLSDEISAYFYAQVGTDRPNRVHLSDIFASMLDLQYIEEDWNGPAEISQRFDLPQRYVVLHVGASEEHKSLKPKSWAQVLRVLAQNHPTLSVVLVGAAAEAERALEIKQGHSQLEIIDLVGKTQIAEIFAILKSAEMLIGCDSAPIHMASLTDTPTFNVSLGQVNFWETGPKASLAFIYRMENEQAPFVERMALSFSALLSGQIFEELITRAAGLSSYKKTETIAERFQWDLVQALYLGASFPLAERMEILEAAAKLKEINDFAMEQILLVPTKGVQFIGPLLDRSEEVIQSLGQLVPELDPLVKWYQAEKVRIGPGSLEDVCSAAISVHQKLNQHLQMYIPTEAFMNEGIDDGTL